MNPEEESVRPRRGGGLRAFCSMENNLSEHKYRIGQNLLYTYGPYGRGGAGPVYKVTQLPPEGDDRQYRIKSSDEPHERVVKESQLKRDS